MGNKFGFCCCKECATIGYEIDIPDLVKTCCKKGAEYESFTNVALLNLPGPLTSEKLYPLDLLHIFPVPDFNTDTNGDGFVTMADWYFYNGFKESDYTVIGDWLYGGGRILINFPGLDPGQNITRRTWFVDEMNDRLALLGSTMEVNDGMCQPGLGRISTTDFNPAIGFGPDSQTLSYSDAVSVSGGTWVFKSNTYGAANCGVAFPIMSLEVIGGGLLVVCSSRFITQFGSGDTRFVNCPVFNSIINTPIDDIL